MIALNYFSKLFWLFMSVYMSVQDSTWVCGESWLAATDLQPTAPVLKAGLPSVLCSLCW